MPLSRERVLASAVALADAEGLKALSMRKLAQQVGVEAMSLYNHVKNKDDLLGGIVELVVEEIDVPEIGGHWKQEMRRRCVSAHEVLMRHPWATMLIVSRANVGPASLRYVDATIGCLREAGFSWAMTDHAWNALDSHTYGFTLQKLNFPFDPDEYAEQAEHYVAEIAMAPYPHLNAMAQEVMEGNHDGLNTFEFGLDLLLDGLERMLSRP